MLALAIICSCTFLLTTVEAQSYENTRCKCVCPKFSSVINSSTESSHTARILYIGNGPPNKCNCDEVVLPRISEQIKGKEQEFCPRCECKYENRNVKTIQYVVIFVIWVISVLVVYMAFLIILDPLLNKKVDGSYQEHTNEDDETISGMGGPSSHNMSVRGNVLNRVGHQQDKWKRQVKEQRKNIYDKHTMLN
ncbi:uncharacterized protein CG1161 [Agrilus planipennis]|uniref:Uncharacterized protein CG1161 n=1 Tax=Agrilus planipennis TaxID=224129 RepID=A0A7F5RB16_AGRPL|nr:uncharacterized protein CG1161 [Agrilus planipennis]XP_025833171.1 uncharacterized protein CG1161 [Agrilus planipennis]